MPTYEYRCDACGRTMEIEQRITDEKLTKCPKCGKKKLVRLVGTGNFILKGSGWYKDLYSSAPPKSATKGDDSKSESKSEGKSESKSEGKSESKTEKSEPKRDAKSATKAKPGKPAKD